MFNSAVSIERIERQIEALSMQEQDVLRVMDQKPFMKVKASRLLARIRKDRDHLEAVLQDFVVRGRDGVSWSELVASHES